MEFSRPSPQEAEFGLRAMKTISLADGSFDELEHELLDSVQKHLLHTDYDLDALAEIQPEELAANLTNPTLRAQLVNGMTIVSLASGEQTQGKAHQVKAYADALGVESHIVRDMQFLIDKHMMMFRIDLMRRTEIASAMKQYAKDRGILGTLKTAKAALGHGFNVEEARRYQKLGLLPEGTVGRTYWEMTRRNDLSFPGEPHGPPDPIVRHDLNHVLSGYDTTPTGELQVAAFQAAGMQTDPFAILVFILCQFHLGVRITPVARSAKMQFQPEAFIIALERGLAANNPTFDLDWDPMSIMERPLAEVREEYNIH
ncbi:MAG: hypothetical protein VYE77_04180 [Planctomycetota bacterium]|nr:hypothetical protein [Planctomycetota bacterium]